MITSLTVKEITGTYVYRVEIISDDKEQIEYFFDHMPGVITMKERLEQALDEYLSK